MRVASCTRMTTINSFRDLIVWQASTDLAVLPAGISIPSNLAKASRRSTKAYLNHVSYSLGLHGEVDTLLELIHRRRCVSEPLLAKGTVLIDPVGKMLHGLAESLELRL